MSRIYCALVGNALRLIVVCSLMLAIIWPESLASAKFKREIPARTDQFAATTNAGWSEAGTGSAAGGGISDNSDSSQRAVVATDPSGKPYVAWHDDSGGGNEIYIRRWNGSTWEEVGSGSATDGGVSDNGGDSRNPSLAFSASGVPYLAWQDNDSGNFEIYVRRWNGAAWEEVGSNSASSGGISNNAGISANPRIGFTSAGVPYITWNDNTNGNYEIYVRRWNGTSWEAVGINSASGGGISYNSGSSMRPQIAFAQGTTPYIVWDDASSGDMEIYVRRWNGTTWEPVASGSASGGGISNNDGASQYATISITPEGVPYIGWQDDSGGNAEIYVRRWNGTTWEEVGSASASGGGVSNNTNSSLAPASSVGAEGLVFLAWHDESGGDKEIYVRRWSGSSWEEIDSGSASTGGISNNSGASEYASIAISIRGVPYVAWQDNSSGDYEIYVRRGPSDVTPPATVVDLAAETGDQGEVNLTWTAPGDDDQTGNASMYVLRYYTDTITNTNWITATDVVGEPVPSAAGSSEQMIVTGLKPGRTYCFALKTLDEALNEAEISNSPCALSGADVTPPGAVTDLAAETGAPGVIDLTWTAPGNDGNVGTAATYIVRYNTVAVTEINWSSSSDVEGEPTPAAAGTTENMSVSGLVPGQVYCLALKTQDEVPNTSAVSNSVCAESGPEPDVTPPDAVIDLAAVTGVQGAVNLGWTAPGDNGNVGTATTYIMRYNTVQITEANWATSTDVTGEPVPAPAGTLQNMTISGLTPSQTYYFALKTQDEVPNTSGVSNSPSAMAGADNTPPAAVTDLAATTGVQDAVNLTWTAPGDDGSTGTAANYIIRYNTVQITEANWATSTDVNGEPAPQVAGTPQNMTVTGLSSSQLYYFALKTQDEASNTSGISNSPSAISGADITPPGAVTNLAATPGAQGAVNLSWSAPGDDGSVGIASVYIVRYNTVQITELNWASSTDVNGEPAPLLAGTAQNMTVSGLTPSQGYYFAMKTQDEAPNISAISNSPSALAGPDTTPPAAVTDLNATTGPQGAVYLTWTAPGDDGDIGTATTYIMRYNTVEITEDNWGSSTNLNGEPTPALAGTAQQMTVSGLTPSQTYYFALKTRDEVPNTSAISNSPSAMAGPDTTPPAAITNLAATTGTQGAVNLSWTAPGDDGQTGTASSYMIRYNTIAITEANWSISIDVNGEPAPATPGTTQNMTVSGLEPSQIYYFALKTLDEVPNTSAISNSPSAMAGGDSTPPAAVTDLSATTGVQGAVNLSWTAPGDDGNIGTATAYILRYNTAPITEANWGASRDVIGEPVPEAPGTMQYMSVSGLVEGQSFYFALKTQDEVPNASAISNSPQAMAGPDLVSPAAVTDLIAVTADDGSVHLSWTAPGDDGNSGIASAYLIRYNVTPITEINWSSSTDLSGEPAPAAAGMGEIFTVGGLVPGQTYYFALKTQDEVPNTSAISNSPSAVAGAYLPKLLTVAIRGTGTGKVFSEPAGIDCSADCSHTFEYGTVITLTATSDPESVFIGWTGGCTGVDQCVVSMTQAHYVTAIFDVVTRSTYLPLVVLQTPLSTPSTVFMDLPRTRPYLRR